MKSRKPIQNRPSSRKKPYRTPAVTIHGDIRRLTQMKGGALGDGAGVPKTRTSSGGAG